MKELQRRMTSVDATSPNRSILEVVYSVKRSMHKTS